ncbi:MAG: MBL fold metallo-hydrolase [Ideonella sp.]|nr:MBL fold metallo-hydrolase [Ideonella sp.]MCC7457818.1 MBL fold metallo-hydrolase [Nitrospira sp.]
MSAAPRPPALASASASLIVLRDGAQGLEVLMLRRAERAGDQNSGAAVFPGGHLDARDAAAHGLCNGLDDALASARLGLPAGGLDYWVAAVRECFEEAGLLFAVQDSGATAGRWADLDALGDAAVAAMRHGLHAGELDFAALCTRHGWCLATDRLPYFSHWLTPPGRPKRFDTRFFVALAPPAQRASADEGESTELMWLRPADAIDPARGLKLMVVTEETLRTLAGFERAADVMAFAAGERTVSLTMPRVGRDANGMRPVLPNHWAYAEIARLDPEGRGDVGLELVPGRAVRLSPRIVRVTADNGSVMTGPGTNSYFVGAAGGPCTLIDPGPDDAAHVQALLAAAPGPVTRILVTHTHKDHSPAAQALRDATGAMLFGRVAAHSEWQDSAFRPDAVLAHGERIALGDGCTLRVVHTPGHASNHLCYLLEQEKLLFTGDHLMQGSTVVINPPDGDMQAYLRSLQMLLDEDLEWLAPGHGFLIDRPHEVVRRTIAHRLQREAKVVAALRATGGAALDALLASVYDDVPPRLHAVAARSLHAHLLKLRADGRAVESAGRWALRD